MPRSSRRAVRVLAGMTLMGAAVLPGVAGAAAQTGPASAMFSVPEQMASDPVTDVSAPALSDTGRYVAYLANRRDQPPNRQQLRRMDMTNGQSVLLNPSIDGGLARGNYSRPPVISADGSASRSPAPPRAWSRATPTA